MTRLATHVMKYKFNYAVKGFAAYIVYRDIAHYNYLSQRSFLTIQKSSELATTGAIHAGFFIGLCALIWDWIW